MTKLFRCPLCGSYFGANALRVHMWKLHLEAMKQASKGITMTGLFIEDTDFIIEEIRLRKILLSSNSGRNMKRFFQ